VRQENNASMQHQKAPERTEDDEEGVRNNNYQPKLKKSQTLTRKVTMIKICAR
jgi:hypothetical protein